MSSPRAKIPSELSSFKASRERQLAQALDKKSEAFAQVAKQAKAASKSLKAAIKLEEESKQPQGSAVSDEDLDLIVDIATRLSDQQREKLINILLPEHSATWEDVAADDFSVLTEKSKGEKPPKLATSSRETEQVTKSAPIPRLLLPLQHEELVRADYGKHIVYELSPPPFKKKLILGWYLACPKKEQRFLI